jgi:hypothetical protein
MRCVDWWGDRRAEAEACCVCLRWIFAMYKCSWASLRSTGGCSGERGVHGVRGGGDEVPTNTLDIYHSCFP